MRLIFLFIFIQLQAFIFISAPIVVYAGSIVDDAPYQTIQFTPNDTHRTNLCERQDLLRSGDIDFLDVLRGLELTVGLPYVDGLGYINYDEEAGAFAEDPGYWIVLLDELANRAGFSWRDSYGIVLPFFNNETASDLLLWTVDTYDFSFSEWDSTIDRMKLGIDFPMGFSDSSTILIARNTEEDESSFAIFSFMYPFDWLVWVAIAGTVLFTGLVYRCVSKTYSIGQSTMQPRDEEVSEHIPGVNIFYAALTATGHLEFSPVTYGERILVLSLCFWSLVITATYTANLASVMISKRQPVYPATSLTEAQFKGVSVCVAKGFAVETKVKQLYPDVQLFQSDGLTAIYEDLRDGKCGLVADAYAMFETRKLNRTLNADCSLEWVGRAVDISKAGPANIVDAGVYCTSLVGHVFEYYLKEMERDGFIDDAFEQYVNSVTSHRCTEEETSSDVEESFRLTMNDMGGIFLCHGIACVVGLFVSIFQRYWSKRTSGSSKHYIDEGIERVSIQKVGQEDGNSIIITSRQLGSGVF